MGSGGGSICAIARKPEDDGPKAKVVMRDFQKELRRAVDQWGSERVSERSPWVLVTHGAHSSNKIVLLALSRTGTVEYVVKLPRVATATDGIRRSCGAEPSSSILRERFRVFRECCFQDRVLESQRSVSLRYRIPISRIVRSLDYSNLALKATRWQTRLIHTPRSCWESPDQFLGPVMSFVDELLSSVVDSRLIEITKALVGKIDRLPMAMRAA